jgi:hypothetical protein
LSDRFTGRTVDKRTGQAKVPDTVTIKALPDVRDLTEKWHLPFFIQTPA